MHVIIAFSYAKADVDIRDYGKKVHNLEIEFDETNDKLNKVFKYVVARVFQLFEMLNHVFDEFEMLKHVFLSFNHVVARVFKFLPCCSTCF